MYFYEHFHLKLAQEQEYAKAVRYYEELTSYTLDTLECIVHIEELWRTEEVRTVTYLVVSNITIIVLRYRCEVDWSIHLQEAAETTALDES